ncbi:hypothetical protein K503DRAFT_529958 [Rhizopogon vinicolor AM-OR11-026]|uniref:Uncharacterized protein n=1 Tax=Rhizopogon vinicolor AM-OR11-026 TaxID=1314800 RepID=A0A1B7ML85_9AGAM|nr:hypothetical protein K503DRAFT_529958 [Rhizopogon vinicolor AM-OR11-026]
MNQHILKFAANDTSSLQTTVYACTGSPRATKCSHPSLCRTTQGTASSDPAHTPKYRPHADVLNLIGNLQVCGDDKLVSLSLCGCAMDTRMPRRAFLDEELWSPGDEFVCCLGSPRSLPWALIIPPPCYLPSK